MKSVDAGAEFLIIEPFVTNLKNIQLVGQMSVGHNELINLE